MWFILVLLWAYVIIFNDNISTIGWWFLLLLWVGLAIHYGVTYQIWRTETKLRRQERREKIEAEKRLLQQNLEGEYVPRSESEERL